jgi:hypothetical protein
MVKPDLKSRNPSPQINMSEWSPETDPLLWDDVSVVIQGGPGSGRSTLLASIAPHLPAPTHTLVITDRCHAHAWETADELVEDGGDEECADAVGAVLRAALDSWFARNPRFGRVSEADPDARFCIVVDGVDAGPKLFRALTEAVARGRFMRVSLLWTMGVGACVEDVDLRLTLLPWHDVCVTDVERVCGPYATTALEPALSTLRELPPFSALVERGSLYVMPAQNSGVWCP